jgi:diacylglycerol kinase (ATP)
MIGRTLCIINPAAGRRCLARWRCLEKVLRSRGFSFDEVVSSEPRQATAVARERSGKYDLLVAVGGDGTVFEVINGMVADGCARTALAIVPFGTGNDSAQAAGIRNEEDALRALASGRFQPIDLIEVRCRAANTNTEIVRYAMLFASIGITGDLLRRTTSRVKSRCGQRLAYVIGLLLSLPGHVARPMKVRCDGEEVQKSLILVSASNGQTFGGGIRIAPGAAIDDGKFNVNLIDGMGVFEVLRHLRSLYKGRHISHPKVWYQTAQELEVQTEQPLEVAADGDLIGVTPANFVIRPKILRLLVPT